MFRFIGFVIRYAPVIVAAITLVEGITSKDTSGEDKKALVIATIKNILSTLGVTVTPEIEQFIGQVIDIAVTILNFLGVFQHRADAPDEPEVVAVPAETVARAATVIRENNDARLAELEALLLAN